MRRSEDCNEKDIMQALDYNQLRIFDYKLLSTRHVTTRRPTQADPLNTLQNTGASRKNSFASSFLTHRVTELAALITAVLGNLGDRTM